MASDSKVAPGATEVAEDKKAVEGAAEEKTAEDTKATKKDKKGKKGKKGKEAPRKVDDDHDDHHDHEDHYNAVCAESAYAWCMHVYACESESDVRARESVRVRA